MIKNVLPWVCSLVVFASCSTAYQHTQTPDDVYYSPGKPQTYAANRNRDRYDNDGYQSYTSNREDRYLRMKVQNRYQWSALDDYNYWYSPSYAYNNFYGFNNFNPYGFNSWGLNYYYSPFASIQPIGWFNSFYPSYGFGYGYTPYFGGYYGHASNYGYYGYTPVNTFVSNNVNRNRVSRPLLGSYTNNSYNNSNTRGNDRGGRWAPANNGYDRYNNSNNNSRLNNSNNNNTFRNNTNNYTPPARTYSPSSSGSSSSGGGGVSRQTHH